MNQEKYGEAERRRDNLGKALKNEGITLVRKDDEDYLAIYGRISGDYYVVSDLKISGPLSSLMSKMTNVPADDLIKHKLEVARWEEI